MDCTVLLRLPGIEIALKYVSFGSNAVGGTSPTPLQRSPRLQAGRALPGDCKRHRDADRAYQCCEGDYGDDHADIPHHEEARL